MSPSQETLPEFPPRNKNWLHFPVRTKNASISPSKQKWLALPPQFKNAWLFPFEILIVGVPRRNEDGLNFLSKHLSKHTLQTFTRNTKLPGFPCQNQKLPTFLFEKTTARYFPFKTKIPGISLSKNKLPSSLVHFFVFFFLKKKERECG